MRLRKLLMSACLSIAFATGHAWSEASNVAKVKVQLAEMRASIVDKDEKTKHVAHTEAEFALLAIQEVDLQLAKMAMDSSDDQAAAFDASMINLKTAVRQFLTAAGP